MSARPLPTPAAPRVLIVDDVMLIQRYVADILEQIGVSCTFAEDGAAALLKARSEPIDLIILDLAMPIMSGWEFLREISTRSDDRRRSRWS